MSCVRTKSMGMEIHRSERERERERAIDCGSIHTYVSVMSLSIWDGVARRGWRSRGPGRREGARGARDP